MDTLYQKLNKKLDTLTQHTRTAQDDTRNIHTQPRLINLTNTKFTKESASVGNKRGFSIVEARCNHEDQDGYLGAFAKLRTATISLVTSVRLFAWSNSASNGRIFF